MSSLSTEALPSTHVRDPLSLDRMVMFFIALLLLCFTISNTSTRIFVAVVSMLVAALIMWCVRTAWKPTKNDDAWRQSLVVLRRTRGNVSKNVKEFAQHVLTLFSIRHAPGDVHSTHPMTDRPFDSPVAAV